VTLTLTQRSAPPAHVDASALSPSQLDGMVASDVAALALRCGRDRLQVGDLFDIAGQCDGELVLRGDLRLLDGIGHGMAYGRIRVEGDVGAWAGAELAGGQVIVEGSAGDHVGAAFPGARAGMTGGEIVVTGDAGEEAGAGMRRGLLAVGGRAGAGAGLRMLAGTIIALGGVGAEAGMGNKRGSIVSVARTPLLPGYAFATRLRPPALGLQLRRVRALGLPVADALLTGHWARWSGDGLELNRGEILIFDDEEDGA
jgi:formylmethanofuran dehydrogenase subunit C